MKKHIFIDAFGTPDLNHLTESTHYIIAAVFIEDCAIEQCLSGFESVRKTYFQTGPMKSMTVSDNHKRRISILNELNPLDFKVVFMAVDKRRVSKDGGLIFKKSFFKFMHQQLYRLIYASISDDMIIKIDSYGDDEFKKSFYNYLEKRFSEQLFKEHTSEFVPSPKFVGIQVADFMAGSLARYFDAIKGCHEGEQFVSIFGSKIIGRIEWPPVYRPALKSDQKGDAGLDSQVRQLCWNLATQYLTEHRRPADTAEEARVEVLSKLVNTFMFVNDTQWITRPELMQQLSCLPEKNKSEHFFKTSIIATLRDAGVILASSKRGYKVPARVTDLTAFVENIDGIIHPMLARLSAARKSIRLATHGKLDILDEERVSYLRDILGSGSFS